MGTLLVESGEAVHTPRPSYRPACLPSVSRPDHDPWWSGRDTRGCEGVGSGWDGGGAIAASYMAMGLSPW